MEYEDLTDESVERPTDDEGKPLVGTAGAVVCLARVIQHLGWSLACINEGGLNNDVKQACRDALAKSIQAIAALGYTLAQIAAQEEPPT